MLTSLLISGWKEAFNTSLPIQYKYTLSLLVICRNESMVIQEFIEHYKWQGVEHIYLIDNDSNDNMKTVIQKYIDEGYVSYYFLPEKHVQVINYNKVYQNIRNETKWLIICDADEYIYHKNKDNNILSYVSMLTNSVNAIVLHWKMFGSSGHKEQPESIRKSFIWKAINNHPNVKCIINTANTPSLNIHTHNHESSPNNTFIISPNELELNHYAIMSEEYFRKVKMTRGAADRTDNVRDMEYYNKNDTEASEIIDTELKNLVELQ
jgi:hypothetical protein